MRASSSISVFGLGHVGLVQAACLAEEGLTVIGVDVDVERMEAVAAGRCPIVEPGLPDLIGRTVGSGMLRVCSSVQQAVRDSDVSLVCIGTPQSEDGRADTGDLLRCIDDLADALSRKAERHGIVVRSTLPVGAMRRDVLSRLAPASNHPDRETTCLYVPEFMREGNAIQDYRHPAKIVIGAAAEDERSSELIERIYGGIAAPRHFTSYEMAEMAKYADNVWHALKICFANEMDALSTAFSVDGGQLMRLFAQDRALNISDAYLRPGMAFGGSCLPKDLAAVRRMAGDEALDLPLLTSVAVSNERQLDRDVAEVLATGGSSIGVWGLSFKPGTSDLRRSPSLAIVERLLAAGRQLAIHDENIEPAALVRAIRAASPILARAIDEQLLRIEGASALYGCEMIIFCHAPTGRVAGRSGQRLLHLHS